jgi:hypothetical protein
MDLTNARLLRFLRTVFNSNTESLLSEGFPNLNSRPNPVSYYEALMDKHPNLLINLLLDLLISLYEDPTYAQEHDRFFSSLKHLFATELHQQRLHNVRIYLRRINVKTPPSLKVTTAPLLKSARLLKQRSNYIWYTDKQQLQQSYIQQQPQQSYIQQQPEQQAPIPEFTINFPSLYDASSSSSGISIEAFMNSIIESTEDLPELPPVEPNSNWPTSGGVDMELVSELPDWDSVVEEEEIGSGLVL